MELKEQEADAECIITTMMIILDGIERQLQLYSFPLTLDIDNP